MALRQDARRNRERILAGAREVFASGGIEAPVEEITRHAGVGMGTLYRHFPAKEDLIDAVLEEAFDSYVALAEEALAEADAWLGFVRFLQRALELYADNRALMHVLDTSARGRARAQATRERIRPLLEQLVERAQAAGALRGDVTAEDVPVLFWSAGRVIEMTADVAPDLWRRYLALVVDGLRPGGATPLPVAPLRSSELVRV